MNTSDIDMMLAEKGYPCISMIIPTARFTRERMQNPELIERAILRAEQLLTNSTWPHKQIMALQVKLDSMRDRVAHIRCQEGLAIFISPNIFKIILLPFTVKEKVILGRNFEIRDLIYFTQFLNPSYLLATGKKRACLLKGSGNDLREIINNDPNDPKHYIEEYEYDIDAVHPLAESAWKQTKEIVKASQGEVLLKLQEDFEKHLAVDGIRNVWKAAKDWKGLTLLLEKDYQVTVYSDPVNDTHIYLTPPVGKCYVNTDAVNDVIQLVKEKGGNVVIVENGELKNFERVALILRYQ